jgi:hypothetical protein
MHFNIYLDDETGQKLQGLAQTRGESRNALIRRALREWIERQPESQGWPPEVLAFEGMPDLEPFEAQRATLRPPLPDPLA